MVPNGKSYQCIIERTLFVMHTWKMENTLIQYYLQMLVNYLFEIFTIWNWLILRLKIDCNLLRDLLKTYIQDFTSKYIYFSLIIEIYYCWCRLFCIYEETEDKIVRVVTITYKDTTKKGWKAGTKLKIAGKCLLTLNFSPHRMSRRKCISKSQRKTTQFVLRQEKNLYCNDDKFASSNLSRKQMPYFPILNLMSVIKKNECIKTVILIASVIAILASKTENN